MGRPLDHSLCAIFTTCHDYYLTNVAGPPRKGDALYEQIQSALTKTLRAMATVHAVNYSGYTADERHAGYLIKLEPPMLLRVPYHVLPTFPTGRELEALWTLSRTVRSGDATTISISGSNVLRLIFDIIGDIDFCEYFPIDDPNEFDKIASNMDGTENIMCSKLALGGREWHYPWGEDRPTKAYFATTINTLDEAKSSMKMDYLGDVDHLGVIEISNVIIAVDQNGKSASLHKTFAAQEAPLVPIETLPNQMNDPVEMGRYIDWLATSIRSLGKNGDTLKCLKRCASLSRILFLPEITEQIRTLAGSTPVLREYKRSVLEKVHARLDRSTDARSCRLRALVSAELEKFTETGVGILASSRSEFDEGVRRIADKLLGYLHVEIDKSSARVA